MKLKLTRLKKLHEHLGLLINLFENLHQLSTEELAVKSHHIFIDKLAYSYDVFLRDISARRLLKEMNYDVHDSHFGDDDRRRFAKELPYVRIDLMRTPDNEPLMIFNAFFFLGNITQKGDKIVTCFQREYEVFADSYEGNGTLGKLFRLMTEIELLDEYEEKLNALINTNVAAMQ